jgi:dTDP-4-amino-4,6-dideoxygalactose transaminase
MALLSLRHFEMHRDHNRRIFTRYRERSSNWHGLRLYDYPAGEAHNFQYAVLELDDRARLTRDELLELLRAENVQARRYFHPGVHHQSPYVEQGRPVSLPYTEALCQRTLQIPLGPTVTDDVAARICDLIDLTSSESDSITRRLRERPTEF